MILLSAPIIQPILVFLTYINVQDTPLDAATAFTTLALFNVMRFPFAFMPMGLLQLIQSKISLNRISTYLALPELKDYVVEGEEAVKALDDSEAKKCVVIKNSSFKWIDEEDQRISEAARKALTPKPRGARGGGRGKGGGKKGDKKEEKYREVELVDRVDGVTDKDKGGSGTTATTESATESESAATESSPIILQDVDISFEAGKLYAVVGSVGSGKSSLISAILGEMEPADKTKDKVYLPLKSSEAPEAGYTTYASQTPWVVNDTLRGNVLFSRPYDKERYEAVLEACALQDDLNVLPAGDLTEIGERGINLSGGQKARVSLARAMYSQDVKLLLLDDPLSAVDSHVGEHLFENAISSTTLCPGATRILVTHHVHFLHRCDGVVVMEEGKVSHFGKYEDLKAEGVDFAGAIMFEDEDADREKGDGGEGDEPAVVERARARSRTLSVEKEEGKSGAGDKIVHSKEAISKGKELTKSEEREEGSVSGSAYTYYCKSGGLWKVITIFLIQGVGRSFEIAGSFWLAKWASESITTLFTTGQPLSSSENSYYLNIYAAFGMIGVFFLTMRAIIMAMHRLAASRKIHNDLTTAVMRAPVSFFDVTPIGRVLNRFAADMDRIDLELTQSLGQGVGTMFSVLGAAGAIVAATKGTMLAPFVPIGYLYYLVQKWFRKSSTEVQRVESITKSPIFSDFSQTLSGTGTIRAYGKGGTFFGKCLSSFDVNNAAFIMAQLANNWLGIRLDVLGGLIAAFIGGIAVATESSNFISAGWLGLALSYSIEVTGFLKHGVKMIAQVEAQMNSVERVLQYTENVEPESDQCTGEDPAEESGWPQMGEIIVDKASLRYRDGPEVLKQISFKVKAGEKIGVVGRTGSGKSSLMTALFRIVELSHGRIQIDGIDVGKIGTEPLRKKLSIIPQDPVLFSNTIKYNLDPFDSCSDDELWGVLKQVQLQEVIEGLSGGLSEVVVEGGENFSQGQRQLICIARSLLRKPKILVMDEATASIDNVTDGIIQTMIRECFKDATVLTIAHRLNTIMDSDKILVLDDGNIAEYDSPGVLMKKEGGIFKGMVEVDAKK